MEKRRVGFISSNVTVRTGFSDNAKAILSNLYKKDKYEIFYLTQGTHVEDPSLQKTPWKSIGTINPNEIDENRFHNDPGYQKAVSYGNVSVQNFIIENKLDVVIHIEDIWSSSKECYIDAPWWKFMKNNFLQWTTLDSLPILPLAKEWAKNSSNMWVWASFAEKALKQEDPKLYSHVRTVPGTTDLTRFHPISNLAKKELRAKFNIQPNEKIIFYLGRNQLRKVAYWANLEALAQFNKMYPEHKVKLLYHCSWEEKHSGWDIKAIMDECKVDNNDVLTSYYCSRCAFWSVQPYQGEGCECPQCKDKTFHTAGIGSNISNEDLNKIYNLADGVCSSFTSGGLEFVNTCSLLAGIPLACSPYSCGEDFTQHNFVYTIDGSYTREAGTNFKKFVPNIYSIVKFYKKICELKEDKRKEIITTGRKWALEYFDTERISSEVEKFIDNAPPIYWNYTVPLPEFKDSNYPFKPEIAEDESFVKDLYLNILKSEPDKDGFDNWINTLKYGRSRKEVYDFFINVANNFNLQNQQKQIHQNTTIKDLFICEEGKKKVLYVLPCSYGDHIIFTGLIPALLKKYPKETHQIFLACDPRYFEVHVGNEDIKLIPYIDPIMNQEISMIGNAQKEGVVDIYCHVSASTQNFVNYLTNQY